MELFMRSASKVSTVSRRASKKRGKSQQEQAEEALELAELRHAFAVLDDHDVSDLLSPLQMEELINLGYKADRSRQHPTFHEAADCIRGEHLRSLFSPLQQAMLIQRAHEAAKRYIMCDHFFQSVGGNAGAPEEERGQPIYASILNKPKVRSSSAPGAGTSRRRVGTPPSDSTDDTASGASQASSVSWISDAGSDVKMQMGASPSHRSRRSLASQAHLVRSSRRTDTGGPSQRSTGEADLVHRSSERHSTLASERWTGPSSAGAAKPARPGYASYKKMPSAEDMAARAAERMGSTNLAGPNTMMPWEAVEAGALPPGAATALGRVAAAVQQRATETHPRQAFPGALSGFERVKAEQQRRAAAGPAAAGSAGGAAPGRPREGAGAPGKAWQVPDTAAATRKAIAQNSLTRLAPGPKAAAKADPLRRSPAGSPGLSPGLPAGRSPAASPGVGGRAPAWPPTAGRASPQPSARSAASAVAAARAPSPAVAAARAPSPAVAAARAPSPARTPVPALTSARARSPASSRVTRGRSPVR